MNKKALAVLGVGHMVTDLYTGSLPGLLPFLAAALNLNYTGVGILVMLSTFTSSVIQPLFGFLADRWPIPWFLPLGCLLAALGLSLMGVAPSHAALLALVAVSGFGTAIYHPEASSSASRFSGARKASGMSLFAVGGNVGVALGPLTITPLVLAYGLHGTLLMIIPALLVSPLLWRFAAAPRASALPVGRSRHSGSVSAPRQNLGSLALLVLLVTLRSWTYTGLLYFVPFWVLSRGGDLATSSQMISAFLLAGAAGTLAGGFVADRVGRKGFVVASLVLVVPLIQFLIHSSGLAGILFSALAGAVLISSFSVTVVMAQELLPKNVGVASGLTIGFAIGTGGLGVAALGWLADHWSLLAALTLVSFLPVAGAVAGLLVEPGPRSPAARPIAANS